MGDVVVVGIIRFSFFLGGGNEPVFVRNPGFVYSCGGNESSVYQKDIWFWIQPPVEFEMRLYVLLKGC